MKYIIVIGARPNFMKAAPLCREFENQNIDYIIYHSGQHYDYEMSKIFEDEFGLSTEKIHHETRQQDNAIKNIEETIVSFKKFLSLPSFGEYRKISIIVFGDVNTSYACALATKEYGYRLIHMEAGLRSFDISMPEELNRITIDHLSDLLFTTCTDGVNNLINEGIKQGVIPSGNLMIDTLVKFLNRAKERDIPNMVDFRRRKKEIITVTLHRPENVDNYHRLCEILDELRELSRDFDVALSLHPRTKEKIKDFNLWDRTKSLICLTPLGYLDFLSLILKSKAVITDSGGLQEETTYLKIPCFTVRKSTERPITVKIGSNTLVEPKDIGTAILNLGKEEREYQIPSMWDGLTSKHITRFLMEGK